MEPSFTRRGVDRLRRALDTLGVKLFAAIAGAHLVLVLAIYLVYSWSFDQGLVEYVNQAEQARLAPMIERLADEHRQRGDWRWVVDDREAWTALLRETLGGRDPRRDRDLAGRGAEPDASARETPDSRGSAGGGDADGGRDGLPPITIDRRVLLFDASQVALIPSAGSGNFDPGRAVKLPIEVDSRVVGYLGYVPRLRLVQSLESITAAQQSRRFGVIALGMFAAVLFNAALISHWLSRRLRALGQGAAALAQGDYAVRLPADGHDEIARLAADFNHLAQALEAARRSRQQWIADIAHELRTPLATLRCEIEAMQDGVRALGPAALTSLAQEVQRLTRLVEDLRLLSLSDVGALTYRKAPLAIADVIRDVLVAAQGAIVENGLTVETQLDPTLRVEGDAERLAQVFGNLLQNTLRYSDAPARLRITVHGSGDEVRTDWEDSSPGVADVDLPRLSDRLFRVDASRARRRGGSGVGLAIAKAIVEGHGGSMQPAGSALGGLRWSVWVPRLSGGR